MRPIARSFRRRAGAGRAACLAAAALFAFASSAGHARSVSEPCEVEPFDETPTAAVAQQGGISLDQARRLASERYPGRVVRAETTARNGRRIHEIRILVEGEGESRMRIVRIDAETGRFL